MPRLREAALAAELGISRGPPQAVSKTDIGSYVWINVSFHDELARTSGNAKLHETYSRLVAELSLFRRQAYLHDRATMALSLREHRAVFDAVPVARPDSPAVCCVPTPSTAANACTRR